MSAALMINTNGKVATAAPVSPPTWLSASVREFFTGFNWEDHPPEVQELKQQVILNQDVELSMELTVSQFFGAIPWDGLPASAAPALSDDDLFAALEQAPAADSFTLDDFSSLF